MKTPFDSYVKILLICWLITPLNALGVQEDIVRLGANESPPYWSNHLPHDGMCGEIVHAISKEAGVQSRIKYVPLKRLIEDDSNNDLGNPIFYLQHQDFAAIIPIAIYHVSFFYYRSKHKDGIVIQKTEDLKRYRIGILKGTLVSRAYFEKTGIHFEESYSHESLFKKLKLGRIDLILEIDLVAQHAIDHLFPGEPEKFESIKVQQSVSPIAIMIAEDFPDARKIGSQYREGLNRIVQNGTYQKILDKYYGQGNTPLDWFKALEKFQQLYHLETTE